MLSPCAASVGDVVCTSCNGNRTHRAVSTPGDIFVGRWKQYAARLQQTWARWHADAWRASQCRYDHTYAQVQERYGRSRALTEIRVRRIERGL